MSTYQTVLSYADRTGWETLTEGALVAIAEELRTANLIALYRLCEAGCLEEAASLFRQIVARLGVMGDE